MTVIIFLLLVTAAARVGATVGFIVAETRTGWRYGRRAFTMWPLFSSLAAVVVCGIAFGRIDDGVVAMFPNGYNP